jgi:carboxyl-terminal processing protease
MKVKIILSLAFSCILQIAAAQDSTLNRSTNLLDSVMKKIRDQYVEKADLQELSKSGMEAMLKLLDPFSNYITRQDMVVFNEQLSSKYGGIGCSFQQDDDEFVIEDVTIGCPAIKAGLRAGDVVQSIDNVSLKGKTMQEIIGMVRGIAGTTVKIVYQHFNEKQFQTSIIERESIHLPAVTYYSMLDGRIGYMNLLREVTGCADEISVAVKELRDAGAKGIIFDLRNNEGGLVSEAIKIANFFLDKGSVIVREHSNNTGEDTIVYAKNDPVYNTMPIVLLVNEFTVSAGEILTGALQDNDRALVLGQRTYGKGLVQKLYELPDGGHLKLTIAYYFTPSGRCIESADYPGTIASNLGIKEKDSTKNLYMTLHGRKVYSYGGINPDIQFRSPMEPGFIGDMIEKGLFFHFAREYQQTHPSFVPGGTFNLSETDYEKFLAYTQSSRYHIPSRLATQLKTLAVDASNENYSNDVVDHLKKLQEEIEAENASALTRDRNFIQKRLEEQIMILYSGIKNGFRFDLDRDPEIREATKILNDQALYYRTLNIQQ